jgi:hypothetical protein
VMGTRHGGMGQLIVVWQHEQQLIEERFRLVRHGIVLL